MKSTINLKRAMPEMMIMSLGLLRRRKMGRKMRKRNGKRTRKMTTKSMKGFLSSITYSIKVLVDWNRKKDKGPSCDDNEDESDKEQINGSNYNKKK